MKNKASSFSWIDRIFWLIILIVFVIIPWIQIQGTPICDREIQYITTKQLLDCIKNK